MNHSAMHAMHKSGGAGPQSSHGARLLWPQPVGLPVMDASGDQARPATPAIPDPAALAEVMHLTRADLGMRVAAEVMHWRSDHEQFADCWVDADGKLTGYYYGRPFSPYRDRNALVEVWKRIDALKLQDTYLKCLVALLGTSAEAGDINPAWALHTCDPELACRAALLAVRCTSS
jgi:hypothetical protein